MERNTAFQKLHISNNMKTKVIIPITLYLITLVIFPQVLKATIINVPADQLTIQAGITASSNGDTVLVQPDTYYQNINFNGKNITVGSLFLTTGDTAYISQTVINGGNSNSVVKFNSGETSNAVLSGFTITNGYAYYGAGINCYSGSSPTLSYLNIENNNGHPGDSYGGGLVCNGSSPNCSNLTFTGNYANEGGGVWLHLDGDANFSDCVFTDNTSSHGGAMQISYSSPTIDHSLFYENDSPFGGAVYVFNYSTPEFVNCTFTENTSTYGGAFYFEEVQLPGMASDPIPENNANDVETDLILYWSNGENTETIDLYFDTENPPVTLVLDNVPAIELFDPDQLETETTYYWQVDCKNNGATASGSVWSFTTGVNTSINKTSGTDKFVEIFPNPAKESVVIRSDNEILSAQLFNSFGNLVFTSEQNDFSITLNISDFAPGIYFVKSKTKAGDFSNLLLIR